MLKHLKVQTDFTKRNKKVNKMHRAQTVKKKSRTRFRREPRRKHSERSNCRWQKSKKARIAGEFDRERGIERSEGGESERRGKREAHAPLGSSMSFLVGNAMAKRCRSARIEEWRENRKP